MHFAICNETFQNWPWERTCDFASSLGYTGLEVAPFTLAPRANLIPQDRRLELRRYAESKNLQIIGLHWLLANLHPPDLYLTHPDPAVRHKTSDYFLTLIDLCHDLGGHILVIGSPKQRNLLPTVSRDHAMHYAADVFRPTLDHAAKRNVTLAIEPLGPSETDFLQTAAEGIELIEKLNHPHFRLHLDVKAMSSESAPIPTIIRNSAKHLAHFHANDPNLLGPGMGQVQYEPIISTLREIGYNRWLSVEVFDYSPGPEKIARDSIDYLRRVTAM